MSAPEQAQFVPLPDGEVSAILVRPPHAGSMLVFAHGAGAGIAHPYMRDTARRLAEAGIATLRYHFPYMERRSETGRRGAPDRAPVLVRTVRAAVTRAARLAEGLPLLAGGKSMGGRMTSLAQSEEALPGVRGLVFFGFPLHPPGRPSRERAAHLAEVDLPMLFLQGSRDPFARLDLLRAVLEDLGARATLELFQEADHSFHVPGRSGLTDEEVAAEVARATARWARVVAEG